MSDAAISIDARLTVDGPVLAELRAIRAELAAIREALVEPPSPAAGALLSVAGAARRMGVSDRAVRGWISDGSLAAHRVGKKAIRVGQDDIDEFIRRGGDAR